jgi:histidinol-phosphate/aromatic aminotransferase/cobyric acid decarboxylase-like protein
LNASIRCELSLNVLASAAAAESLRDLKYRDKTLNLIRRERTFLTDQLAALAWLEPLPSETNFLLVRILAPRITSTHLCEKLEQRNILIRDASSAAATFASRSGVALTTND